MKLVCHRTHPSAPPIVPGRPQRAWMDATRDRHAYRCTPLTIANSTGWEILNPLRFAAYWNGGQELADLRLEALEDDPDKMLKLMSSQFGHGILTFHPRYLFTTEPGWTIWVRGAPNAPKDRIVALDGVVESDWLPFTFTMNWMFTRPGKVIFEKDEPLCFIVPMPYRLIEEVVPEISNIESNAALNAEFQVWSRSRTEFNAALYRSEPDALANAWQRYYLRGMSAIGTPAQSHHQIKRRLAEPVVIEPPIAARGADRETIADRDTMAGPAQKIAGHSNPDDEIKALLHWHDRAVALRYPGRFADVVDVMFAGHAQVRDSPYTCVGLTEAADERCLVTIDDHPIGPSIHRDELPGTLMAEVVRLTAGTMDMATVLQAGAVASGGKAIVVAGPPACGKSSLVAWLVAKGFDYVADDVVALTDDDGGILGFPGGLVLEGDPVTASTARFREFPSLGNAEQTIFRLPQAASTISRCALLVFPQYEAGAQLSIRSLSAARAGSRLVQCCLNADKTRDGGLAAIVGLARAAPALQLKYGSYDQLSGILDMLARFLLDGVQDGDAARRFLSLFPAAEAAG